MTTTTDTPTPIAEFSIPLARSLFRNLRAAEETAATYRNLVGVLELLRDGSGERTARHDVLSHEIERLERQAVEHENDADERRAEILAHGFGPEHYDAWLAAQ